MRLFYYEGSSHDVKFTDEAKLIAPFRDIIRESYKRAKKWKISSDPNGRNKELAYRELAFIHYASTYNSKFVSYEPDEKVIKIKQLVGLPDNWQPDDLIIEGCSYYADSQITPSYDIYLTAREGMNKLKTFIQNYNPDLTIRSGALLMKPKEFIDTISSLKDATVNLNELEKIIREEQDSVSKKRGGRRIKKFEA